MKQSTKTIKLIGGHVSMAGGLDKAVGRTAKIEGNCMQIFSGSPRSWARTLPTTEELRKLFSEQEKLSVRAIFTHALYLVNLASDKPELVKKSVATLVSDLTFDSLVKGSGVVVHLGSHQGRGWDAVKENLLKKIKKILNETPPNSRLLIENSAGQKGKIASDLNEIKWLLERLNPDRVGWCLDTCHAFAAGYPLSPDSKLSQFNNKHDLLSLISQLDLADSLKCVHVNDSKVAFDSGNDRHDNIGEGEIPQEDLRYFLRHDLTKNVPLITEAPGFDGKGPDVENINRLKKLAGVGES